MIKIGHVNYFHWSKLVINHHCLIQLAEVQVLSVAMVLLSSQFRTQINADGRSISFSGYTVSDLSTTPIDTRLMYKQDI